MRTNYKSSRCAVSPSFLGPDIFLGIFVPNILSPCSSLSVTNHVSYLCKAEGNIKRKCFTHALNVHRVQLDIKLHLFVPRLEMEVNG